MSDRNIRCQRCKCYQTEDDFLKEGRILKTCINCRNHAKNYRLKHQMCIHNLYKYYCKECGGSEICKHNNQICKHKLQRHCCKTCSDPIKVSIQGWIKHSKKSDKKYNRYDVDRFIDRCFLKELVKDYPNCFYCKVELQYIEYNDTLSTIERLDNSIGHIKSNCVLACRQCNYSRARNKN